MIIDRFEQEWAVIEYQKKTFKIPISLMPAGAREGDVIEIDVSINNQATTFRSHEIDSLVNEVLHKEG